MCSLLLFTCCLCLLLQWNWKMPIKKCLIYFSILSDFVSFPLFEFTLVIKLRNFDFKSHWNTSIFSDKKNRMSDLNMLHKNVWFCFISTVCVHSSDKTGKFWFLKSLKYFNIFWQKKIQRQIWICLMEKCLILFHFHSSGSL